MQTNQCFTCGTMLPTRSANVSQRRPVWPRRVVASAPFMLPLIILSSLGASYQLRAETHAEPVTAIWLSHEFKFSFSADTVRYRCDELAKRVSSVLTAVGAARHSIDISRCLDFDPLQRLTISATVAAEATEHNLHAATQFSSAERLLSEIRKSPLPTKADVERFQAEWRTVQIRRAELNLHAGDCELLHDIKRQVFTKIGVGVNEKGLRCMRAGNSIFAHLSLMILMPV
jgi:hypothetical protein